ncbi:hypothetical protein ACP70R_047881 [Stipagrostis hirtigluma subsp. patula]
MDLVTGAIGNLTSKLLRLLRDEYRLQKGVKKKIQFLALELESIHGALRKVAAVPPDQLDEQVKIWARQAREASYDMEDILDTFLVHEEGCPEPTDQSMLIRTLKKMGEMFMKFNTSHDIGGVIEDIKKQLQEIADRRARYRVDEIVVNPVATSTIDPRLEAMYKEVTQLVGINKSMGDLIPMLSLQENKVSNKKMKIVSVLGIGGLGKTTLAKALYDKLKPQFDCEAFVPVGREPDLKKVFRDILIDLDKNKYMDVNISMLDERQLINELRDFLGSKRYFIVIDDIWETQSWERIKLALVENNRGSRIILTTRKLEATCGEVYILQPLSHGNSKRLFYTRIFSGEEKCLDNQEDEVSDKILKKCGGVPLAIITMASLLVGKRRGEWSEVCNSTGFGDKDIEQVDTTTWILSLSYYDLPCHLRTCLLYLSTFPEDYIIDKNSLIWKWVAEDFIHKKPGIGLFQVGEGYFNDLINRSMVQAVESKFDGIIYGCRVHDMVLDLLRYLSREENFATVLGNEEDTISISSARRLAHQNRIIEYGHLENHNCLPKLRSFIAHSCRADKGLSLLSFRLLRVLALENVRMDCCHHVKHIGNLLHLRYLGLRNTNICELPKEIGALKFLQILDLWERGLKELPSSVGLLTQLVRLRVRWTRVPDGIIEKLTSLEDLDVQLDKYGQYKGQFLKDLVNLSELRVLKITNIEMNESMGSDFLQSVGNLHKIQSLTLGCYCYQLDKTTCGAVLLSRHLRHLFVPYLRFYTLPSCIKPTSHPNLSHLDLYVTAMDEQSLTNLGGLPELRYLSLSTESTVTVTNIAAEGCFQKLRYCKIPSSMVRFVLHEDSSVSFTIWNGKDDIAFGSRKKDECRAAPPVMQNLEVLEFRVHVMSMRKCKGSYDNLGLEYLTSLQETGVFFECKGTSNAAVMEAEASLKQAIDVHPNHPTLFSEASRELKAFRMWQDEIRAAMALKMIRMRQGKEPGDSNDDLVIEELDDDVSSPVDDDVTNQEEEEATPVLANS